VPASRDRSPGEFARIRRAVARGWRRRCPHCGRGSLFGPWGRHIDRCDVCGLVYERNPGDTWFFTIIGDRIPIAAMVAFIYFNVASTRPVLGLLLFAALVAAAIWTSPNRWGVGIALHYLSRLYLPEEGDPLPPDESFS
jgi:uncharacterized protein (DUF983 family)